jgi:hypothetical protein
MDGLRGKKTETSFQAAQQIHRLAASGASDDDKKPVPGGFIESTGVKVGDPVLFFQKKMDETVEKSEIAP